MWKTTSNEGGICLVIDQILIVEILDPPLNVFSFRFYIEQLEIV